MTREETSRILNYLKDKACSKAERVALSMALAALRGPTREMVERMRGEWIEDEFAISHCSLCGCEHEEPEIITPFCPLCGSPMTDEAVQMVMEKLKKVIE